MLKKFFLFVSFVLILSSFSCIAAEIFEYDNILYTIDFVVSEDGSSSTLELTAESYVDSSLITYPPRSMSASEIYDLLGYNTSGSESTDISSALSSLGTSALPVEKSSLIKNLTDDSSGGYYDENGLFIPYTIEELLAQSEPATVQKPDKNEIKVVLRENFTDIETKVSFPDQKPVLVNDRTLIPVRGVFEQLGYTVDWNDETSTATVSGNDIMVSIPINSNIIYKNDKEIKLDVPAQLIGGRTMIPLRAVSKALGLRVEWEGFTKTVVVYVPF